MQIELAKTGAARPAAAFAVVVNVVHWPQIISSIRNIEVLTPGPVREGTRLREDRIMFRREGTQELEVATIERPRRLRLLAEHPHLRYELDHVIDSVHGGGCRIRLIFRSRPGTPAERALQPLDELERDLFDLASQAPGKAHDVGRTCRKLMPIKAVMSEQLYPSII
jgi:hypothetical protein